MTDPGAPPSPGFTRTGGHMRQFLADLGIATAKDAAKFLGTVAALLLIVGGTGFGMIVVAVLAGVALR